MIVIIGYSLQTLSRHLAVLNLHGAGYLKAWDKIIHPGPGSLVPWIVEINLKYKNVNIPCIK